MKKYLKKVAELYNLGKIKEAKELREGLVNYNTLVKTDRGEYVVRVLGSKLNSYKKRTLKLEFNVLEHLKKKNFPYELPLPLKNMKSEYLSRIDGKNLWVYKKLDGKHVYSIKEMHLKEIAKALGEYHRFVKDLKINQKSATSGWLNWIEKGYDKLKKVRLKNKVDRLMLENIDFFYDCLKKLKKTDLEERLVAVHRDFNLSNLLFKNGHLSAIIDFDNIEIHPRSMDLANAAKDSCMEGGILNKEKYKKFLSEYEKFNHLTKKEKELVIPYMIADEAGVFYWFYSYMKKKPQNRYNYLKRTIETTKNLVKESGFLER